METTGSPKFLGTPPCLCAHALRLRSACTPLTHTDGSTAPAIDQDDGAHIETFEALSHGVEARGLRFVQWITPLPRKTRFQVLVRLSWAGVPPAGFR